MKYQELTEKQTDFIPDQKDVQDNYLKDKINEIKHWEIIRN
jgi:hypothetical protein